MPNFTTARKYAVALVGVLVQGLQVVTLPEQYQPWVTVALALATALGVYHVPNDTPADGA